MSACLHARNGILIWHKIKVKSVVVELLEDIILSEISQAQ